ncbi:MAG: NAD-dependent epimerase/dehydratase family protein [Chloroflexaceae bacterium]|nr:NAD-dependent epimerase/dehydratase family protein [Chloroflexaceae bacterium]NJO04403.1 NAD-dependent epimerase/dehydratase family protein [Chloroflexaceae bacterium]
MQAYQTIVGTGPLGLAVMRELLAQGKAVRMVNRSGKTKTSLPQAVELVQADASNPTRMREVFKETAVVYHCATAPYTGKAWETLLAPLMQGIIAGAAANGAKVVYGDNVYAYGHVRGPIAEELPETATTRKGRARARIAQMLRDAHTRGEVQATIGRGSDFFGPEVLLSLLGDRAFPAALQGKAASMIGNIDMPHTYTFIDDFGKALVTLGAAEQAYGETWHVPTRKP